MSTIRRPDRANEWWVDFRWRGKRVRKRAPLQTKRGAEHFERQLRNEITEDEAHGIDPFARPSPSFAEFSEEWLREYLVPRRRPSTVRAARMWLRNHLVPAFGQSHLDQITTRDVDGLVRIMEKNGLSPKSVRNALSVLHTCLDVARRWKLLRTIPEFEWPRPGEPRIRWLREEDAQALVDACDPGFWKSLVVFFLHTGLRFSEAAALTWEDIDNARAEPVVHVTKGGADGIPGPTKTGSHRDVPLDQVALDALRSVPDGSHLIFPTASGRQMNPAAACKYLYKFCDRAGIERCGWHVLRHTYASRLAMEGVPVPVIMALLGHTSLKMTMRYVHPDQRVMNATAAILARVMPAPRREWSPNGHREPNRVAVSRLDAVLAA